MFYCLYNKVIEVIKELALLNYDQLGIGVG
jgi:hypothetical protein